MIKFSLKRILKIVLILIVIVIIGVLLVLGLTVFKIGLVLTSMSDSSFVNTKIKINTPTKTYFSPLAKHTNLLRNTNDNENTNKSSHSITQKQSPQLLTTEKYSLEGFNTLLNTELGRLQLCSIQCDNLKDVVTRIKNYSKGNLNINYDYNQDQAFQLAARINQAGLGPPGKEAILIMYQLQKDSISLSSAVELGKLLWRLDEIVKKIDDRTNARAIEADELMKVLQHEANTCEANNWTQTCSVLEAEIDSWIDDGALL